jgi:hypothetical protein
MRTSTQTAAQTVTLTATNICVVNQLILREIQAAVESVPRAAATIDPETLETEVGILILNEVISDISLQIYVDREVVREYRYVITDQLREAWGPPAERPPLGPVPEGARIRVVVTPNPKTARETRDKWFRRLGWCDAEPLLRPAGVMYEAYGVFASGGFAVERQLLVNPKYDRSLFERGSSLRKDR